MLVKPKVINGIEGVERQEGGSGRSQDAEGTPGGRKVESQVVGPLELTGGNA